MLAIVLVSNPDLNPSPKASWTPSMAMSWPTEKPLTESTVIVVAPAEVAWARLVSPVPIATRSPVANPVLSWTNTVMPSALGAVDVVLPSAETRVPTKVPSRNVMSSDWASTSSTSKVSVPTAWRLMPTRLAPSNRKMFCARSAAVTSPDTFVSAELPARSVARTVTENWPGGTPRGTAAKRTKLPEMANMSLMISGTSEAPSSRSWTTPSMTNSTLSTPLTEPEPSEAVTWKMISSPARADTAPTGKIAPSSLMLGGVVSPITTRLAVLDALPASRATAWKVFSPSARPTGSEKPPF